MNPYKISQGAVISLTRSRCTVATLEVGKVQYYGYLLKCDFFFSHYSIFKRVFGEVQKPHLNLMSSYLPYTLKSECLMSFCISLHFNVFHLLLSMHGSAVLPGQRTLVAPLAKLVGQGLSYKRCIPQDAGTTQRLVPRSVRPQL